MGGTEHGQNSICCLNPTQLTDVLEMKYGPRQVPQERLRSMRAKPAVSGAMWSDKGQGELSMPWGGGTQRKGCGAQTLPDTARWRGYRHPSRRRLPIQQPLGGSEQSLWGRGQTRASPLKGTPRHPEQLTLSQVKE